MGIPKQLANKVLSNLDVAAARIEELAKSGKMDGRVASALVRDVDAFADRFEVAAFGADSFKRRQAKLLEGDADEKARYMSAFDNVNDVIDAGHSKQPYLNKTPATAMMHEQLNFDQDRSSAVSDRVESQVVGLSNGTHDKQHSQHVAPKKAKFASTKTWAD